MVEIIRLLGEEGEGQDVSPKIDKFTITNKSGDKFDPRFIGGEIKIPNPQVDTSKFTLEPHHQVPTEYKSDVENVKNQDTLVPEKPFTIIDTRFKRMTHKEM